MRELLFTTGSPFARAVRILLDELALDYDRREELTTPSVEARAKHSPALQVPVLWDGDVTLWDSGVIAEYLLTTYRLRPDSTLPLAPDPYRADAPWHDREIFATIQTFGTAATLISQMRWGGVTLDDHDHLQRSAKRMDYILTWLDDQILEDDDGFWPGTLSMQDIFLACHIRFVEARPLGIEIPLDRYPRLNTLLARLAQRPSFLANPVWWWEPGVTGYRADGTPIFGE